MGKELAYVLINPYTIAKSRTGGVIARYCARTDLDFVGARMFGPSRELASRYAAAIRKADPAHRARNHLLADYVARNYAPDPGTGRPRRVMMLLFEGSDAIHKIYGLTGSITLRSGSGETIRDTYGDYVVDADGRVGYFEPAVLVAPTRERAALTLRLWARYSPRDGGIVEGAADVPQGDGVETTLVLLKPDNFRQRSLRPGNIVDLLSSSGLRIVGARKFRMTVAQAEEFYGPVRAALRSKFRETGAGRAAAALRREFGFDPPASAVETLSAHMAPLFAQAEFENIVRFMTGYRPTECSNYEKKVLGSEKCLALVYRGVGAVRKIRDLLGTTDPSKARPGSVRREFGSDVMVNAAHASDSAESARRELAIIRVEEDNIRKLVGRHYGSVVTRAAALRWQLPEARCRMVRALRESMKTEHR